MAEKVSHVLSCPCALAFVTGLVDPREVQPNYDPRRGRSPAFLPTPGLSSRPPTGPGRWGVLSAIRGVPHPASPPRTSAPASTRSRALAHASAVRSASRLGDTAEGGSSLGDLDMAAAGDRWPPLHVAEPLGSGTGRTGWPGTAVTREGCLSTRTGA